MTLASLVVSSDLGGGLLGIGATRFGGTWLMVLAAVLTIWSMVYDLRKAVPEIRAKAQ